MDEITKLENADVDKVRVANARTRPNSTGLYGGGTLSADEVKKIFDQYPDLLRGKLAEVIDFANALLKILGNGVEGATITGALNSLSERVGKDDITEDSRFDSNTLASAILKLSKDMRIPIKTDGIEDGAVTTRKIAPNAIDLARLDAGLQQLVDNVVRDVDYDSKTATLKFHRNAGDKSIDLPLESLFKDVKYDDVTHDLIITMWDGKVTTVPLDAIADRINAAALEVEANVDAKISPLEKVVEALLKEDELLNQSINELHGNDLDMEPSGCYRTEEGIVLSDKMGRQVIIPLAFAAELRSILKAGQGIKLDYDANAKKLTVSATGGSGGSGGGGTTVKVNGEAVSEFDADTKLDKMTGTSSKMRLYAVNKEGKQVAVFAGVLKDEVVTRADKGNIILPPKSSAGAMEDSRYAAPLWYVKQYVEEKIGDIQSALEELHTYAQSLIGGNEE